MSDSLRLPAGLHCAQDYEERARHCIPAPTMAYIAGGSGRGATLAANRRAFSGIGILPRVLRELGEGNTRLRLAGCDLAHPILLAPVAFQCLAHPLGELETARAAAASDSCMVASTLSSHSLEAIAGLAGPRRWFQLYFQARRDETLELVRRAEAAGYGALVVTVDAAIQAPSLRALRAGFRMPAGLRPANLPGHSQSTPARPAGASRVFAAATMSGAPTRDDIDWLAAQTALPLIVKGILRPDDALALKAMGVAGLVVSNHGGRSLDGVPASLSVLPSIRQAVGAGFPLLFDSGIRSGSDVFKAIAAGADAVMIGRLQVYALAVAGALGVAHMVRLLREELELCMAASGCRSLADVDAGLLAGAPAAGARLAGNPRCC
jgi:isopentenyl diphosphate isomerase/L-lactate dehydrogenase-like FMN-dependent dehydrogenase